MARMSAEVYRAFRAKNSSAALDDRFRILEQKSAVAAAIVARDPELS
jgi:hypothetical protein